MKINLRLLYLYQFSFVGLLILVFGSIRLIDLGLKIFVFPEADRYEIYAPPLEDGKTQESQAEMEARQDRELTRRRQQELSSTLAMIVVGLPLYLYHWRTIQKE